MYKVMDFKPSEEGFCLLWIDPEIGINWPFKAQMAINCSKKVKIDRKLAEWEGFIPCLPAF
jgi:dTDP-4-dehydrorhamnose 3,5-epimerase-like enzyme